MRYVLNCMLLVVATTVSAAAMESAERPNIVLLLADDQCTYSMGCYGNQDVQTPHLDQLALDGHSLLPLVDDPQAEVRESLLLINVWGPAAVHSLSVVSKEWKYVYWPYAEGDYEPTEELYCTRVDPLELANRRGDPAALPILEKMRNAYDAAVVDWRQRAVPYHRYVQCGALFDRHVAWRDKRDSIPRKPVNGNQIP